MWRAWTQEQIAKAVGLSRARTTEIVGNIKSDKIDNLLSEGRDMDYIDIMKRSGWEITHIIDCPLIFTTIPSNLHFSWTLLFKYQQDNLTRPRCEGKAMPPGKGEKGLGALISKPNLGFWGTPHYG